jgi:hypothetical protein
MSITLSYPFKVVDPSAEISSLMAAHSPVIITAARKDVAVTSTANSGGFVQVTLATAFTCVIGDRIYLESGVLSKAAIITAVGSTTLITTDLVYSAATAGGFMNNFTQRANYYIETIISKYDSTLTTLTEVGRNISRPSAIGIAKIDISRLAQGCVDMIDIFTHGSVNEKDHHLSAYISPTFTEFWTGSTETPGAGSAIFVANAAMQIGNSYDSNMADYWPILAGTALAKWLSASTKLRYYYDYPFDVSFYMPFNFSGQTLLRETVNVVDGVTVSTTTTAMDDTQHSFINRVMIAMLRTGGTVFSQILRVKANGTIVTENLEIREVSVCKNPFYVKWVNTDGSWNYFMFMVTQVKGRRTSSLGEFGRYIETLSTAKTDTKYLGKESVPFIVFGCETLDTYDIELMESLIDSPEVQYLSNPATWATDGEKWQTIKVDVGSFTTRITKHTQGKIELRGALPEKKLQTQ